jgi:phage antirepressor YoqD-like protein
METYNKNNGISNKTENNFNLSIFEVDQTSQTVNLTKMAENFGKSITRWLASSKTKAFVKALESANGKTVVTQNIGNNGKEQGTFGTREVALKVAQWISPEFEVYCIKKLDTLFEKGTVSIAPIQKIDTTDIRQVAKALLLELDNKDIIIQAKTTQNNELQQLLEVQAPVVSFVEKTFIKGSAGLSDMKSVAHECNIEIKKFYKLLRDNKIWFYKLNEHGKYENTVMAKYITSGDFVIKQQYSSLQNRAFDKIFCTPKGKLLCFRLVSRESHSLPNSSSSTLTLKSDESEGARGFTTIGTSFYKIFIRLLVQSPKPMARQLLGLIYQTASQTNSSLCEVVEALRLRFTFKS